MAKKLLTVALLCMMIFPIVVMAMSLTERTATKEEQEKAQAYFQNIGSAKAPSAKQGKEPYTIAYVDIDPYPASGEMLYYFVEELRASGWITYEGDLPFQPKETDAGELIRYLAGLDLGPYIRFDDDANYYIAVEDKESCKERLRRQIDEGNIDLIFCMGTSPGEMVLKDMQVGDVPVMVYFSVDPVGAGLSESEAYSGQRNVWCHTSSEVYANQIQFYYNNDPFHKIGMVYYSESVAAISAYRKAADAFGFEIAEKKIETLSDAKDGRKVEEYYETLKNAFWELVNEERIDAFMLNTDLIKDESRIKALLDIFYEKKIPVFVQNGEFYVKGGALMVVTASDAQIQAPFAVDAMAQILNGAQPGSVYQKFIPSPYLSINLSTADRIGYPVSEEMLLSAEALYH